MDTLLNSQNATDVIENLFEGHETSIARDLKMNLKRLAEDSSLIDTEFALILLSLAQLRGHANLKNAALKLISRHNEGASNATHETSDVIDDSMVREAVEAPAIMSMLNGYYKFRRFMRDSDQSADEVFGAAKLRMQSLAKPNLGHDRFEMLALVISIANGCEQCVTSHVEALKKLGAPIEKIHDIARLAATTLGTIELLKINTL